MHVKGEETIYGIFKVASRFMENPEIPENFKSKNLLIETFKEIEIPYETFL